MTRENTSSSPIRAAIYCRISSDPDDTQMGVERQEKDCRQLCRDRDWEVAEVFTDNDISAANRRKVRPSYQRLLDAIKASRVDAVVVWDEDRLHRQLRELVAFVDACEDAGLTKLGSVGGDTDLNDPDALMMLKLKCVIAEAEISKGKKRMKRAKLQKAERGEYSGGGTRPFGYDLVPGSPRGVVPKVPSTLVVNEAEAAHIRWAAKHLLDGGSLNALRYAWMERGVETVRGVRTRDGSQPHWSTKSIGRILTSPRIAGLRDHNGEVIGEAAWDAILDLETWNAVCAILHDPSRRKRDATTTWPLRGVLTCSGCGATLYGKKRSIKQGGARYYRCDRGANACGKAFMTAHHVEKYAINVLLYLAGSDAALTVVQSETEANEAELRTLITKKGDDEANLRKLDGAALDDLLGDIPVDRQAIAKKRREIQKRVDAYNVRIGDLRGASFDGLGSSLRENWDNMTADEHRRAFLSFVSEIRVWPPRGEKVGSNHFDSRRLEFVWRSGALASAVESMDTAMMAFVLANGDPEILMPQPT